ncbi:FAD-binding oxidoreductase, partial [Arthrobacter deserti]|nr:FAD-binding oxidoreductase [Arthrobacter deserti]
AEAGAQVLAPMRAVSHLVMDTVAPMSYLDVDQIHMDPPVPFPFLHAGEYLRELSADTIAALLRLAGPGTDCPVLEVEIDLLGGAYARGGDGLDAVSGRNEPFMLLLIGLLAPPAGDALPGAIASILVAMAPFSSGRTLVNLPGVPGDEADRARAWPPEVYARLVRAKAAYDPDNLLRFQHAVGQEKQPA